MDRGIGGTGAHPVRLLCAGNMGSEARFRRNGSGRCTGHVLRPGIVRGEERRREFRQVMSAVDGMTIDSEPAQVSVGGRPGYRVDFSGVGLFRSMIAIEIRCHVLTFNLTSRDPEFLASLVRSLDNLASVRKKTSDPVPECLAGYATSENVVHRVEPDDVGAKAVSIPVRMIVATDGSVKHVHVIRASAAQRRNIEEALRQWKFKSYVKLGRPVEVETGMTFNFKPANM